MMLAINAHAAYALSAIDIESPHGYALFSGNPREETGKKLGGIVAINDKLTVF